ncbi:MAG: DUF1318 domain-containing protein [Desulfobacterales bacterium]|nr:DUF1318 domain-containing protein [Desulfobacterales bacterium]
MKHSIYILILALLTGCTLAQVDVEMVSERTALENQVLGTYNSLDAQMLLAASVRGVDEDGGISEPPKHSRQYKDAITAMQTLDFHADDLAAFKRLGWVGENNRGYIEPFGIKKDDVPPELESFAGRYTRPEFDHVVSRVNAARKVLMERVIYMNENLKESDMSRIQRVFAGIHAENAAAGVKIQTEDGSWKTKEKAK